MIASWLRRVTWASLCLGVACTAPSGPDGGLAGTGGKSFGGPPALALGVGATRFTPLVDPQPLELADGGAVGIGLRLSLEARSLDPSAPELTVTLLDPSGMSPLMEPTVLSPPLVNQSAEICVALDVLVPLVNPERAAGTVWVDALLVDRGGRQARARGRLLLPGHPDAGVQDGGLDGDAAVPAMDAGSNGGSP